MSAPRVNEADPILAAIRGYLEPAGLGTDTLDFDHPQGIHVDEAEDIPDFLAKLRAALAAERTAPLDPSRGPDHGVAIPPGWGGLQAIVENAQAQGRAVHVGFEESCEQNLAAQDRSGEPS